ncbi:MAG: tRNA lysidine(34) synthetase TilS [Planctomycetota bacterium]|nr:tRNA lysidine(34) synthetase TilS [Planctomycetota bacterium]
MPPRHPFETAVSRNWPPVDWSDVTILVAVSGGPDSVALLRALARLHCGKLENLVVAHFNHQLRAQEADDDEVFVCALAAQLGLACHTGRWQCPPGETLPQSEAAARDQRYEFLTSLAKQIGARYVATGHTADDQAETILHRVIRGTGIGGLTGMPRSRRLSQLTTLMRPLRELRRQQVREYLEHLQQPFRDDSSNTQRNFTRNRIRLDLLPQLERDFNPRVQEALCRLAQLATHTQAMIDRQVTVLRNAIQRDGKDGVVVLDCAHLDSDDVFLLQELLIQIWKEHGWPLREMGLERWESLAHSLVTVSETSKRFEFPGQIRGDYANGRLQLSDSRNKTSTR